MKKEASQRVSPAQLEDAAAVFAALSHPVRLRMAAGLLAGECCVAPMAECLDLPQPFVSRHLAVLRAAGVIRSSVQGRTRVYQIAHPAIEAIISIVESKFPSRE